MNKPSSSNKRIGVIGAGPSGLAALKEFKEKGYEVIVFEKQPTLGGVYLKSYENLVLTTSNVNIAFGAYPVNTKSEPKMWSGREYINYLREYAEHFDLLSHIRFSTQVDSLYKDNSAGRWVVEYNGTENGPTFDREEFHHVVICSGVNTEMQRPTLTGEEHFEGQIIHSSEFKRADDFVGRKVLIIGLGESGSDISLEIARVAKASAISSRKGPGYLIPRHFGGRVSDLDTNRCYHAIPWCLGGSPLLRIKASLEARFRSPSDDDEVLSLTRKLNDARGLPWQRRFSTKNTSFIEAMLRHGTLYKPDVRRLEPGYAVFTDGSIFHCDTIICCTGFAPQFPFLVTKHPQLAEEASQPRHLFKRTFHPDSGAELSWLGLVRPGVGSIPICSEMQARYVALVVSGERSLPPTHVMLTNIEREARLDLEQFPDDAPRLGTLTDYMRFLDGLGRLVGCNPPLMRLFFTRPAIWAKVMFSPISGAQFRLDGPGASPLSTEIVLKTMPTMPRIVIAYEFMVLLLSKVLSLVGIRRMKPFGF